jgi:hypothetical protein
MLQVQPNLNLWNISWRMDIRPNWNYYNLPVTLTEFRIMSYLVSQMKAIPTYIGFFHT